MNKEHLKHLFKLIDKSEEILQRDNSKDLSEYWLRRIVNFRIVAEQNEKNGKQSK